MDNEKNNIQSESEVNNKTAENISEPNTLNKHKKKRIRILVSAIIILCLIAWGVYYYYQETHYVTTDDSFVTGRPVYIVPHISDYVAHVHVINDQHVNKGDLLVEIDPKNFFLQVEEAQAGINISQARLNAAVANYEITIDAQNTAAVDMHRNQILMAGDTEGAAISQEKFEHSISLYQAAVSAVLAAKAGIMLAQSELQKAKVDLDQAKVQFSYTKIYAPVSGYITKRNIEPGSFLSPGYPVMAIVSDNKWVVANLKETQLEHIRVGQSVDISIDAYPGAVFKGHVKGIQAGTGDVFSLLPPENATGNYVKVVQRVPVEITFDAIPDQSKYFLSLGMSVEPIIKIK
ncbi:MAG TPA: hypothetical protein DD381_13015 [Lentisphaeria bacterium]|nr:MAG: hypothetical protein A2X47_12575 [Lentisphaerae bacterium GWF2_38_69]HBM17243.1 hypothetical protein [Lentisphaeria bacterium]